MLHWRVPARELSSMDSTAASIVALAGISSTVIRARSRETVESVEILALPLLYRRAKM